MDRQQPFASSQSTQPAQPAANMAPGYLTQMPAMRDRVLSEDDSIDEDFFDSHWELCRKNAEEKSRPGDSNDLKRYMAELELFEDYWPDDFFPRQEPGSQYTSVIREIQTIALNHFPPTELTKPEFKNIWRRFESLRIKRAVRWDAYSKYLVERKCWEWFRLDDSGKSFPGVAPPCPDDYPRRARLAQELTDDFWGEGDVAADSDGENHESHGKSQKRRQSGLAGARPSSQHGMSSSSPFVKDGTSLENPFVVSPCQSPTIRPQKRRHATTAPADGRGSHPRAKRLKSQSSLENASESHTGDGTEFGIGGLDTTAIRKLDFPRSPPIASESVPNPMGRPDPGQLPKGGSYSFRVREKGYILQDLLPDSGGDNAPLIGSKSPSITSDEIQAIADSMQDEFSSSQPSNIPSMLGGAWNPRQGGYSHRGLDDSLIFGNVSSPGYVRDTRPKSVNDRAAFPCGRQRVTKRKSDDFGALSEPPRTIRSRGSNEDPAEEPFDEPELDNEAIERLLHDELAKSMASRQRKEGRR